MAVKRIIKVLNLCKRLQKKIDKEYLMNYTEVVIISLQKEN